MASEDACELVRGLIPACRHTVYLTGQQPTRLVKPHPNQLRETNSMVEEFMLLANVSVAEAIVSKYPTCR